MARIEPFKAYHFNALQLTGIEANFAPPYDIISPEYCRKLAKNPVNMVHLTLPHMNIGDLKEVRNTFEQWKQNLNIIQPEKPGFYIMDHYYNDQGVKRHLRGIFALLDLENNTSEDIKKHEATMPGPVEDRKALIENSKLNASPIFTLYKDKDHLLDRIIDNSDLSPLFQFDCQNGEHRKLSVLQNASSIDAIKDFIRDQLLLIADGHHRYKAFQELKEKHQNTEEAHFYRYQLVFMANTYADGVRLHPTHRIIDISKIDAVKTFQQLLNKNDFNENFNLEKKNTIDEVVSHINSHSLTSGLVAQGENYVLNLKPDKLQEWSAPWPESIKKLPVYWLNHFLLEAIMDVDLSKVKKNEAFSFPHELQACQKETEENHDKMALILPNISKDQFADIVRQNFILPQKTTYFYPKIDAGWIIHDLYDNQNT